MVLRSLAGVVGAAAAAAGGAYHWRRLKDPAAADFVHIIRTRLGHLNLDPAGVDRFAREYVARYGAAAAAVHHRETLGGVLRIDALRALLPEARQQRLLSFERHLVSLYLRSTTYFTSPSAARVRYVAFADPYEIGCANPLAKF
jgi:hypothetical protein